MKYQVPLEFDLPAPVINISLPPNIPLTCGVSEASSLFGISERQLTNLRKHNPDFPVRKIGKSVIYLVPELYAWLRDYGGE